MKTKEELYEILAEVDWRAVHHAFVSTYGDNIIILNDGSHEIEPSGTTFVWKDDIEEIGCIKSIGSNYDSNDYINWGEIDYNDEGEYIEKETGKIREHSDLIHEAIEEGHWPELIADWKEQIIEEYLRS